MQKVSQNVQPITIPELNWSQSLNGFQKRVDSTLRRVIDACLAALGLFFLSSVFLLIAFAIHRDSPGPVFYRGPRTGKGGRRFSILKFRTMYERPESYNGARVTAADDERITPLGKWLRDTKINELPQLWNVLVGDMSLVGPRPEDPDIAAQWPAEIRAELLSVRPGITSPATVLFRGEENMLQAGNVMDEYLKNILPTKLRLDSLYVRNRTIVSDLDVLFWTAVVLLPNISKVEIPQSMLYWGFFSRLTSRYLGWFSVDMIMALAAVSLSELLWRTAGPLNLGLPVAIGLAIATAVLVSTLNFFLGLGNVEWRRAPAGYAVLLAVSTAASVLLISLLDERLEPNATVPDGMLITAGMLAFIGFVGLRYRDRLLTGTASRWLNWRGVKAIGERILIVGAGEASLIPDLLLSKSTLSKAFTVVGMVDDDPRKQGRHMDGCRVLGTTQDIPALVQKYDVGILLFAITNITPDSRRRILQTCRSTQTLTVILPDLVQEMADRFRLANTLDDEAAEAAGLRAHPSFDPHAWLDEMEQLAEAGELEVVRGKIKEAKENFRF